MGWGGGGAGVTRGNNNTIIHVPERTGNTLQNASVTEQQQQQKTVRIRFRDNRIRGIFKKNAIIAL